MGRLFLRKKFSDYLGEQRAIDDIYIQYVADGPAPSPSPTPSVTPTPTITPTSTITPTPSETPSVTPTNTPSVTPSITPSVTPSITPSITPTITPTNTGSPTPTPTLTPTPTSSAGPSFDPDAAAYLSDVISAGGSINATISAATDTLYTSLKSNGLYPKLNVFYPMIGGTQNSNSIMGKRTSGTTFDIVWTNPANIIFNSLGVQGDGSTTLGDTNFNINTQISNVIGAPSHTSIYCGTNSVGSFAELGVRTGSLNAVLLAISFSNTYYGWSYTQGGAAEIAFANTNSTGMYVQSRQSISSYKAFRNGSLSGQSTFTESRSAPNASIKILSDGVIYSSRRIQFTSIGQGLSDGETATLTTIINTFQTTLGRNTF